MSSTSASCESDDTESASSRHVDVGMNGVRKRRRLSPSSEKMPETESLGGLPDATLSRIKTKQNGTPRNDTRKINSGNTILNVQDKSSFAGLNVTPWLVNSLAAMAIRRPTGIQKACVPEILKGRDCIGGSRTGSGKTVAFAVPILQKWAEDPVGIFAVVLTPTRCAPPSLCF